MSRKGGYVEVDNFSGKWNDYKMFSLQNNNGEKYITGYNKKTGEQLRRYEYKSKPFEQDEIPNSIAELNKMAVPYSKEWYKLYMRASRTLGFDDKSGSRNNPRRRFPDSNFQVKGAEKVKMSWQEKLKKRRKREGVLKGEGGVFEKIEGPDPKSPEPGKKKKKKMTGAMRYKHLTQSEKDKLKEEVKESKKLEAKLLKDEKEKIKEQKEVNKAFKEASKKVSSDEPEPEKKGRGKGKVDKKKAFQEKAKERSEAAQKIQTQFRKKKEEDKKKKEAEEKKKRQEKIKADRKLIEDRAKAKAEKEAKKKEKRRKEKEKEKEELKAYMKANPEAVKRFKTEFPAAMAPPISKFHIDRLNKVIEKEKKKAQKEKEEKEYKIRAKKDKEIAVARRKKEEEEKKKKEEEKKKKEEEKQKKAKEERIARRKKEEQKKQRQKLENAIFDAKNNVDYEEDNIKNTKKLIKEREVLIKKGFVEEDPNEMGTGNLKDLKRILKIEKNDLKVAQSKLKSLEEKLNKL